MVFATRAAYSSHHAMRVNLHLDIRACLLYNRRAPKMGGLPFKFLPPPHKTQPQTRTLMGFHRHKLLTKSSPELASLFHFCFFGVPLFSTTQTKNLVFCWGPNSSQEIATAGGAQKRGRNAGCPISARPRNRDAPHLSQAVIPLSLGTRGFLGKRLGSP